MKHGPSKAIVGKLVTYTFTVTNGGPGPALDIVVTDDLCGFPAYQGGDASNPGILDVGEVWTYSCDHTVLASDPDPLPNAATVTTSRTDTDLSNNKSEWIVDLLTPRVRVEKTLTTPPGGSTSVGSPVTFHVIVTNTGDDPLTVLALEDVYDPLNLEYQSASPLPSGTTPGKLSWSDLTGSGDLAPGASIGINTSFKALLRTGPVGTLDTAKVQATSEQGGNLVEKDGASVAILQAEIKVEKKRTDPPGAAGVNQVVTFRIRITNTGDVPLMTVPLEDVYDPAFLGYQTSTVPPDSADTVAGKLTWIDLTGSGDLAPNSGVEVTLKFKALQVTPETRDVARVVGATTDGYGSVDGEASDGAMITMPVGGEITPPDTTGIRAALAVAVALTIIIALQRLILQ